MNLSSHELAKVQLAELSDTERFAESVSSFHSSRLKIWEVPIAYLVGVLAGALAYVSQGNAFLAISVGASISALSIATACSAASRKTQVVISAMIKLKESEARSPAM